MIEEDEKDAPAVNDEHSQPEPIVEPTPQAPKKKHTKLIIIIVAGVLLLAGLGALAWWWFMVRTTTPDTSTANTGDSSVVSEADALSRFTNPTTGEEWYDEPISISKQGYFNSEYNDESNYYEVGTRGENKIIMTETYGIGSYYELFEIAPDDTITAVVFPNANTDQTSKQNAIYDGSFADSIVVDTTLHYDSLSVPNSLEVNNSETVTMPEYGTIGGLINPATDGESSSVRSVVKVYGASSLIKMENKNVDSGLTTFYYAVDLPLGTRITLTYVPLAEKVDDYSWKDGTTRTGTINSIVRGCGATGLSISRADNVTDSDFVAVATSLENQTIYGLKSVDAPLVKLAYDDYAQAKDYVNSDNYPNNDEIVLTQQEFFDDHAVLAFKNAASEWLIYTQDNYALVGGCGKPVVYLYPTTTQTVNVRVGADVTVSEPYYNPATGWKNVTAQPNGNLTYNSISYDSLFWEGTGHGTYPGISSGTVVPRAQAATTIRTQLSAQGLNTKESNDFMAFWESRIPNKPYVQLAWFSTADLNELAPLTIVPKPQTTIRVFLDMRGLDELKTLPAPRFNAPARNGFTVVEWGGLLSGKL
ncbi:MAG: hypothetical protein WA030_02400 [Candidatus Microsaccharimonas sp.]